MRYFEVCKTSKLHSTRSVPPRQGQASCLSGSSRKGSVFTFFLLLQKEPKSRRSALPGRGRRPRRPVFYPAFSKAGEMFPKRNGFILFASTKRTKSSPEGCDPLDSEGRFKTLQNIFSCCFRLSSLSRYVVRPAFSDVLNRCERVAVVQTQDRCFSKMGSHTTSLQEQATFEKGGCSLSLLRWEFVFAVCGLKVLS